MKLEIELFHYPIITELIGSESETKIVHHLCNLTNDGYISIALKRKMISELALLSVRNMALIL